MRLPVNVITGFLGSGKTTLLAHLLRDPALGRTAVIMNEFGSVPLDHDLIETSDESFVRLSTGCLCCNVRSDLTLTLCDLAARREAGSVPAFERVVVETTGLADPAPILHAIASDDRVRERYAIDNVITTIDSVVGLATLDAHDESVRQAALADCVVVTKTDLAQSQARAVAQRVRLMNPGVEIIEAAHGAVAPSLLFSAGASSAIDSKIEQIEAWLAHERTQGDAHERSGRHSDRFQSFCIVRDEPLHAATLPLFIAALAENCGPDLLRVKGIVHVRERPHHPAVIHGVQHVYHAPAWLERWPSDDRRTRMVFIGCDLRELWTRTLLEVIEAEVTDELARKHETIDRAGGRQRDCKPGL